jgi:hypothetical protein
VFPIQFNNVRSEHLRPQLATAAVVRLGLRSTMLMLAVAFGQVFFDLELRSGARGQSGAEAGSRSDESHKTDAEPSHLELVLSVVCNCPPTPRKEKKRNRHKSVPFRPFGAAAGLGFLRNCRGFIRAGPWSAVCRVHQGPQRRLEVSASQTLNPKPHEPC